MINASSARHTPKELLVALGPGADATDEQVSPGHGGSEAGRQEPAERQWRPFAWPLAVMAKLPLWRAVGWLAPLGPLSELTAWLSWQWLELSGFSASQQGLFLYLPGGGVKVAGACGQLPSTAIAAGGQSRTQAD